MTNEEIRKLLGGYATDTLNESERRALFEAALEDQELFNALEDEQALKQMLDDPVSREAIRRALAEPSHAQGFPWWSRRWVWGGLAGAALVAALIVAVVHENKPAASVEIASIREPANKEPAKPALQQAPAVAPSNPAVSDREIRQAMPARISPKAESGELKLKELSRDTQAVESAGSSAPAAAPLPQSATSEQVTVETAPRPATVPGVAGSIVGGLAGSASGFAANARIEPLRYSLLKKDGQGVYSSVASQAELKAGDSVRLNVSSAISGFLSLYRQAPGGEWTLIFPESPEGRLVAANSDLTIPDAAIEVQSGAEKFRISLTPEQVAARAKASARQTVGALAQPASGTAPLTVDLTIGPGGR